MGVSSTRVGDHRGSARTVQYLSKNHMMVSGLRSARSGSLPHLAVFARQRALCVSPLSPLSSLSRLSIISLSISSRLVILGWQWSASPGVVRFHPGLVRSILGNTVSGSIKHGPRLSLIVAWHVSEYVHFQHGICVFVHVIYGCGGTYKAWSAYYTCYWNC